MSTWNVTLTFKNTRMIIPDKDVLLPGLPSKGEIIRTTPKFLERGEDNDWSTAVTWQVESVEMLIKHPHRIEVLVTLVPFNG